MAGQMKAFWDATGELIPASCCSGIPSMLQRAQLVLQ